MTMLLMNVLLHHSLASYRQLRGESNDETSQRTTRNFNEPTFQSAELENETLTQSDIETEISSNYSATNKFDFIFSFVTIKEGTEFHNCSGFGSGMVSGAGGAIAIHYCNFQCQGTNDKRVKFISNKAQLGGAISFITSSIYIIETDFESNTAYLFGGAISYYYDVVNYDDSTFSIYILSSSFQNNKCDNTGGAVSLFDVPDTYIEKCNFKNNKAQYEAGALELDECKQVFIKESNFESNSVNWSTNFDNSNLPNKTSRLYLKSNSTSYSRVRGGGAIYSTSGKQCDLTTNDCCFNGNHVQGHGNDILLNNNTTWKSNNDMTPYNDLLYQTNTDFHHVNIVHISNRGHTSNRCGAKVIEYPQFNYLKAISFAATINSINPSFTANVPDPTTFTYAATPITMLPRQTTQSYHEHYTQIHFANNSFFTKISTASKRLPPPSTRSPEQTPKVTVPVPIVQSKPNDVYVPNGKTLTQSKSKTDVLVLVNETLSETKINGAISYILVSTNFYTYEETILIVYVVADKQETGISAAALIGFATAGLFLFFLLAGMGLFLWRQVHKNDEDFYSSDDSCDLSSSSNIGTVVEKGYDPNKVVSVDVSDIPNQLDDLDNVAIDNMDDEAFMNNDDI